jgi:hypothetical protein
MIERPLLLFGITVVAIFGACSAPTTLSRSRFLASFSPADVIKRSYAPPDSHQQPSISTGGTSSALGTHGVHHSYDSADLSVSKSDEPQLLLRIKREIVQQIEKSGGKVVGEGSGENDYSIEYADGKVSGWVDVVGMRGAGDSYRLVIIVTEK